jgi:hypothetical protein
MTEGLLMDMIPYIFSVLFFGFLCFAAGVNMGAKYAVKRITEEFNR